MEAEGKRRGGGESIAVGERREAPFRRFALGAVHRFIPKKPF